MRLIFPFLYFLLAFTILHAQPEKFDLVSYTRPADSAGISWQKAVNGNICSYTAVNPKDNSWCRINIVQSTASLGNIGKDFDHDWKELILGNYTLTGTPKFSAVRTQGNWKSRNGTSTFIFDNKKATALMRTLSGFDRCLSLVVTTNSPAFQSQIDRFMNSVTISKPQTSTLQEPAERITTTLTGTWVVSASDQSANRVNNGVMSTIWRQYTLNANGTYSFISKLFDPLMDHLILGKESGTFLVNGTSITLQPDQSVLESWTKQNGAGDWGKKISSQKVASEKTTYQFAQHYNDTFREWQLILSAEPQTKRDGPYNSSSFGGHAWIYISATEQTRIKMPGQ